jgi:enoyl-CoA hydratase/3-hydroxyacyl-CoA dehydrogenase
MNIIPVRDVPSFAADRLFCGMMLEAVRIHASTGLSPAQIDDACKQVLGTSPFFVHNLIRGANALSAHCMELMQEEVDSSLYAIPDEWRPYIADPGKQWPYERGQRCPPEQFEMVRERMLGMLFALTAYMAKHEIAGLDAINFLAEKALAFREGPPALIEGMGLDKSAELTRRLPRRARDHPRRRGRPARGPREDRRGRRAGWHEVYVGRSVMNGVGLLSLKRTTLNFTFIAELDRALEAFQRDPDVHAIVLAPDGHLQPRVRPRRRPPLLRPGARRQGGALKLIQTWKATLAKLRGGKPTVAALVGRVLGGGLELATCCHARIAAEGTMLGQPEATVGVLPGLGGCHQIHRFSAPEFWPRINEILLTGDTFTADEAVAWGFVSKDRPDPRPPARQHGARRRAGRHRPAPPPSARTPPRSSSTSASARTTSPGRRPRQPAPRPPRPHHRGLQQPPLHRRRRRRGRARRRELHPLRLQDRRPGAAARQAPAVRTPARLTRVTPVGAAARAAP